MVGYRAEKVASSGKSSEPTRTSAPRAVGNARATTMRPPWQPLREPT